MYTEVSRAPIAGIARRNDAVIVGQTTSEYGGSTVWLTRKNGRWIITRAEASIG